MYAMELESLCVSEANGPLHVFFWYYQVTEMALKSSLIRTERNRCL